ncbi:MAG: DUF3105 domain-containing protein [Solirubrobacteraceae bacterium]|jgi:hypothetical protein
MPVWLERLAIAVAALALAVALVALMSGYFAGHDTAAVSGTGAVGLRYADQGDGQLVPGYRAAPYDSNPPTSGPHARVPVLANGQRLSDDQILTALASGDVVIVYGSASRPAGLQALAGPFTRALAAAGDAVILAPRPGTNGLIALSWTRMLRVSDVHDPLLAEFIQERLGRGAAAQ